MSPGIFMPIGLMGHAGREAWHKVIAKLDENCKAGWSICGLKCHAAINKSGRIFNKRIAKLSVTGM